MIRANAPTAFLIALFLAACATQSPKNLHQVDSRIWRSAQPSAPAFRELEQQGIREVLCLRRFHSDDDLTSDHLKLHHVRMRAGNIRDEDIIASLRIMASAREPMLVHCFHGADRTGVVIAMYRMVIQEWPREKAIAELEDPAHGHHANVFPNIREYLETVDVTRIRNEVFKSH